MMLMINPMISTPTAVPPTEPLPPVRLVPPITTAAMASSSQPWPILGSPQPIRPDIMIPTRAAKKQQAQQVGSQPDERRHGDPGLQPVGQVADRIGHPEEGLPVGVGDRQPPGS